MVSTHPADTRDNNSDEHLRPLDLFALYRIIFIGIHNTKYNFVFVLLSLPPPFFSFFLLPSLSFLSFFLTLSPFFLFLSLSFSFFLLSHLVHLVQGKLADCIDSCSSALPFQMQLHGMQIFQQILRKAQFAWLSGWTASVLLLSSLPHS